MDCIVYQDWILEYEQLTAAEQEAMNAHLRVCPQCREVAREWRALDAVLTQQLRAPAVSASFDVQLRRRIANESVAVKPVNLGERRCALEAEYAATWRSRNMRSWIPRVLDVLGYGVAGGIGGWLLATLLRQPSAGWTASLTLTGAQLLVASSAAGIAMALGLGMLAFSRPVRRALLR